jgi:hypothetical protein
MSSVTVPTLKLSTTGDAMPIVGTVGVVKMNCIESNSKLIHRYRLSYDYNQGLWKVPENACAESVYQAIKAGYRMFDSSSDYANEHESGKGLKRAIDEGLVKREDVFIVTKLWNTFKVSYEAGLGGMQGGIGVAYAFG